MTKISYSGYRFPPEIIQQAIWLYVRFTSSFRDVEDLLAERGILVSYETVRRWVNHFGPKIAADLRKPRPKPHTTWHLDEVYLKINGRLGYLWRAVDAEGEVLDVLVQTRRNKRAALKLMRNLLKKYGFVLDTLVTDDLRYYEPQPVILESQNAMNAVDGATIERKIRINRPDEGRGRCEGSRAWDPRKDFSRCKQQHKIPSTSNVILPQQERTEPSGHRPRRHGAKSSLRREPDAPGDLLRAIFGNVTEPSLPGGRYTLPAPDLHRPDRASFAWRTTTYSLPVFTGAP